MKLTQITYRRLFNTGSYTNEAIELTASLSENEDTLNAYTQLHEMCAQLHFSKNKEFYEQTGTAVRDIEPGGKEGQLLSFIEAINTTTSLKSLEIFKKLVGRENNPQLTEAYDNKLKTFQ